MSDIPPLTITKQNYKSNRSGSGKGHGRRVEDTDAVRNRWPLPEPKKNYGWQEDSGDVNDHG